MTIITDNDLSGKPTQLDPKLVNEATGTPDMTLEHIEREIVKIYYLLAELRECRDRKPE